MCRARNTASNSELLARASEVIRSSWLNDVRTSSSGTQEPGIINNNP